MAKFINKLQQLQLQQQQLSKLVVLQWWANQVILRWANLEWLNLSTDNQDMVSLSTDNQEWLNLSTDNQDMVKSNPWFQLNNHKLLLLIISKILVIIRQVHGKKQKLQQRNGFYLSFYWCFFGQLLVPSSAVAVNLLQFIVMTAKKLWVINKASDEDLINKFHVSYIYLSYA